MRPPQVRLKLGHKSIEANKIKLFRFRLNKWWLKAQRSFPWRRANASKYHQVVSEVLLQRTRAETVAAFWGRFIRKYPNWNALADSSPAEIQTLLQPLGLSRQRAPRLYALACVVATNRGRFDKDRSKVDCLPGVGQYIGNAVMLFHHQMANPLLDVNMARVLERFFGARLLADIRYDRYLQELAREVLSKSNPIKLNWAILDFAALVCRARNPHCDRCPLSDKCEYAQHLDLSSQCVLRLSVASPVL